MKKMVVAAVVVAAAVAAGWGAWLLREHANRPPGRAESIKIGTVPVAVAGLLFIAEERRFFGANGLTVTITDYPTGIATTDALLKGETDIAWVAEFPFVGRAFAKEKIGIIAVVGRFSEQYLFGSKDRGIHTAFDLKGKTIGIPRTTIAEFYLGRFLEMHGMGAGDVSVVDVQPPQSLDAILTGRVDGVIAWEPYSSQARARLADSVISLPVQSSQPGYGLITARNDWTREHPDVVNRLLIALAQAEDHLINNPADAKAILRKRLNYDDTFTETIWKENELALSLDQSLITAMEDEARWMIKSGLTSERQVPDFADYIHTDGLKAVKPGAVNIIR